MKELLVSKTEKILIIAPHPDDESIGTGGLLSFFAPQCDVWLLTDGCMGGNDGQTHDQVAQIREAEFQNAMRMAGVHDFRSFGVKDRNLSTQTELLNGESFEAYKKIFVPSIDDSHPDHVAAFIVLMHALNLELKEKKGIEVFQYEVTAPLSGMTHYIDITDVIENKKALIGCYESQLSQADYYSIGISLNQFRASVFGLKNRYIETYKIADLIPVDNPLMAELLTLKRQNEKLDCIIRCYDQWIQSELSGISVLESSIKTIDAEVWIYGCGLLGRSIYKALLNVNVCVVGFLDKYVANIDEIDVVIKKPDDVGEKEKEYTVLVSAVFEFDNIEKELKTKGFSSIISFASLLQGDC